MRFTLQAVAAASAAVLASPAHANDWFTGAPMSSQSPALTAPIASVDVSIAGGTGTLHGVILGTFAPQGTLEDTGFRARVVGLVGVYNYTSTTVGDVRADQRGGQFLGGYEWVSRTSKVALYGGLDFISNTLDKLDVDNKTAGTKVGARIGLDFYATPTPVTMFAGTFNLSSAHMGYYARVKAGYAIFNQVYVGPEAQFLGDSFYSQWRVGAHLSGIKIGPVGLGVAGGYLNDAKRGGGLYSVLDVRVTF
jgi:hypothetical protein